MKNTYLYVVRKMIPIKAAPNMDAKTVYSVQFGCELKLEAPQEDAVWAKVSYKYKTGNMPAVTYKGFVKRSWVTLNKVHDIAKLHYQNKTDYTFDTSWVYGGPKTGTIAPGEIVCVRAYCSPYALTNKGWVRADLISHEEYATERCLLRVPVEDYEGVVLLLKAVLDQAHSDYTENENLRKSIRAWTRSKSFTLFYGDYDDVFIERCERDAKKRQSERILTKTEIMKTAGQTPRGKRHKHHTVK